MRFTSLFSALRRGSIPITKAIGEIHAPWSIKKLGGADFRLIEDIAEPGDILLTTVYGHLSNLFIPGQWKHVALVFDKKTVIEAVGDGVNEIDLAEFVLSKDRICLLRAKSFASEDDCAQVAQVAFELVGSPYDFEFSLGNKAFYCAELAFVAYDLAVNIADLGFKPRPRLGVETITADDYYNAASWWDRVIELGIK